MKRYIKSSTISDDILNQVVNFVEGFKGSTVDLSNHVIMIPFRSDATIDEIMSEGMLGDWFVSNGFDVSFEVKDVQYITKGEFNARSMTKYKGRVAYLRDRLVMTVTW